MTLRLDEVILGDLVLGFDVKTQQPAFSKLILWAEFDWKINIKYLLIELEDDSQLKLKGYQLVIIEGEPIIIKQDPIIIKPKPEIVEAPSVTDEKTPLIDEKGSGSEDNEEIRSNIDSEDIRSNYSEEIRSNRRSTRSKSGDIRSRSGDIRSKSGDIRSYDEESTPDIDESDPEMGEITPNNEENTANPEVDETATEINEEIIQELPDIVIPTSKIVMTRTIQPGDSLYKRNVGYVTVRSITKVVEKGFCRPITVSGTILVDNIAISCYHDLSERYVKEKHFMTAQTQGKVGYGPLSLWRKCFKGDVEPISQLEKPHPYGVLVNKIFRQKGTRSAGISSALGEHMQNMPVYGLGALQNSTE